MAHEEISLTEWNDTADTLVDLWGAALTHGHPYVAETLGIFAVHNPLTEEVQHD